MQGAEKEREEKREQKKKTIAITTYFVSNALMEISVNVIPINALNIEFQSITHQRKLRYN